MHYMTVVSLEKSDEPDFLWVNRWAKLGRFKNSVAISD